MENGLERDSAVRRFLQRRQSALPTARERGPPPSGYASCAYARHFIILFWARSIIKHFEVHWRPAPRPVLRTEQKLAC